MAHTNVRYVEVRGVRYLRAEDVAQYIEEMAAVEETDVRERFTQAAQGFRPPCRVPQDFGHDADGNRDDRGSFPAPHSLSEKVDAMMGKQYAVRRYKARGETVPRNPTRKENE